MNPNNPTYDASVANRGDQLNPDHKAYHSSRGGGSDDDDFDYGYEGGDGLRTTTIPEPETQEPERAVERLISPTGARAEEGVRRTQF